MYDADRSSISSVPTPVQQLLGPGESREVGRGWKQFANVRKGADAFELRVFLGRDANGRVQHRSRLFHGTSARLNAPVGRVSSRLKRRTGNRAERRLRERGGPTTTINNAITGWKANGWDDLSPSTTRRYDSIWNDTYQELDGRRKIASLSPYDVEVYFRSLKNAGLSEASVSTSSCHVASGLSARAQ